MHEYTSTVRIWELSCPGLREEIGRARRWTHDILSDSPCADDAALIVTELGTNALLHSASGNGTGVVRIHLRRTVDSVAVSVRDSGGRQSIPHTEEPDEDEIHGRGLGLVAALADHLEVRGDSTHGYTVTAELRQETPAEHPHPDEHFPAQTHAP
ncbi:ATP-binding protein [Streptomyces sulphureus]|uniref:ATP-binding protein n=1 Tax=Streptomyces sulphureus TaxID=47758 RepID=UPI000365D483|nr:ATP-binding protein [Streptomyces sulphureus]